jgi:hypothetical protein
VIRKMRHGKPRNLERRVVACCGPGGEVRSKGATKDVASLLDFGIVGLRYYATHRTFVNRPCSNDYSL